MQKEYSTCKNCKNRHVHLFRTRREYKMKMKMHSEGIKITVRHRWNANPDTKAGVVTQTGSQKSH